MAFVLILGLPRFVLALLDGPTAWLLTRRLRRARRVRRLRLTAVLTAPQGVHLDELDAFVKAALMVVKA